MSEEQTAILTHLEKNLPLSVSARAGTGKTTVIEKAIRPEDCYLVFNVHNKKQAERRISAKIFTLNGFGHRIVTSALRIRGVSSDKLDDLALDIPLTLRWGAKTLMRHMRQSGVVPEKSDAIGLIPWDDDHVLRFCEWEEIPVDCIPYARKLLADSLFAARKGVIDFDDQLYLPVVLRLPIPTYPRVFIDEAQDLSPLNHALIARMQGPRTSFSSPATPPNLCIVGDPFQAIYGFRGAVPNGFSKLTRHHKLPTLPLTVSWRCAAAIIEEARNFVPDIRARPNAPDGEVTHLKSWTLPDRGAILCRNNAPLVSLALRLIVAGKGFTFVGRDMLQALRSRVRDIGGDTIEAFRRNLSEFFDGKIATAKSPERAAHLAEQKLCLELISEKVASVSALISLISDIVDMKGELSLSSIHRSKGLEWDDVYILNARDPEGDQEEINLRYVAITRAKSRLFYVHLKELSL